MSATTGTTTTTTERQQNFMKPNQSPSHNMPSNNNSKTGRPCKLTVPLLLACTLLLIDCCTAVNNSSVQAVNASTGELLVIISLNLINTWPAARETGITVLISR